LNQVGADDPGLRHELESLLSFHEKAGSVFLQNPVVDLSGILPEHGPNPGRIGRKIGVYQIVAEVGHGGMGEVYRAVRADGEYDKQVAIKLVRVGLDSSFVLERFRHERQILASLDHPNIARLHDGGTTEDGIPYLVMELIEGTPIDQYCEEHDFGVAERLRLFIQVCAAVQYAHQRLVIHRDIKPSNILVTANSLPKLLDFGIAKILDSPSGAETTLLRPMTPEYASPEQIRGEPISTSTDVYSLGVVLFKLFTGCSPYGEETRTPLQLANTICVAEPARPSSARERRIGISISKNDKVLPRLKGDLDAIILKAIRKEPEQRYSSAEQFAEDIRRHLEGLPVAAVRGSFRYRAGKFIRRNRAVIAATAMLILTVTAGIAATIRQAHIAAREAQIAAQQSARAEKRFRDVRELANSLIFEIHDSIQGLPGATPSRKLLLDRAVEYLDKLSQDSAGDPNLQRELAWAYQRLATVQGDTTQSNLGQVQAAEVSNRKAMTLFEEVAKANPNNLQDQVNLAMAYRWRAFRDIYEPAGMAEIKRALAVTEPLLAVHADDANLKNELADEYYILAEIQDAVGDRLQSIAFFRKVLELRQQIQRMNPSYPDIGRRIAKVKVLLAHEIGRFGSRTEGLQLMNSGIADFEALVRQTGGDPGIMREVSAAQGRRGELRLMEGDVAAALDDYRRSLQPLERLAKLDPENKMLQSDVWTARFQEGRALAVDKRYAQALPILEGALQGYLSLHLEEDVGPGPTTMRAWIAEVQADTGKYEQALKSYQESAAGLAEDQQHFDDARCDLAMVEAKIGGVLLKMGKSHEADVHYQKALEIARVPASLQQNDFPALSAAAEAYTGEGDTAALRAQRAADVTARSDLSEIALESYKKSLDILYRVPNASRLSGNGYLVTVAGEIERRSAAVDSGR
jgi:non-specific serine/threonine protein kinase/serine/threonine-protein kinase